MYFHIWLWVNMNFEGTIQSTKVFEYVNMNMYKCGRNWGSDWSKLCVCAGVSVYICVSLSLSVNVCNWVCLRVWLCEWDTTVRVVSGVVGPVHMCGWVWLSEWSECVSEEWCPWRAGSLDWGRGASLVSEWVTWHAPTSESLPARRVWKPQVSKSGDPGGADMVTVSWKPLTLFLVIPPS